MLVRALQRDKELLQTSAQLASSPAAPNQAGLASRYGKPGEDMAEMAQGLNYINKVGIIDTTVASTGVKALERISQLSPEGQRAMIRQLTNTDDGREFIEQIRKSGIAAQLLHGFQGALAGQAGRFAAQ